MPGLAPHFSAGSSQQALKGQSSPPLQPCALKTQRPWTHSCLPGEQECWGFNVCLEGGLWGASRGWLHKRGSPSHPSIHQGAPYEEHETNHGKQSSILFPHPSFTSEILKLSQMGEKKGQWEQCTFYQLLPCRLLQGGFGVCSTGGGLQAKPALRFVTLPPTLISPRISSFLWDTSGLTPQLEPKEKRPRPPAPGKRRLGHGPQRRKQ